ncbi:MAG: hypothetical protein ACOWWH_10085 [Eubacteriaceae bacterium]
MKLKNYERNNFLLSIVLLLVSFIFANISFLMPEINNDLKWSLTLLGIFMTITTIVTSFIFYNRFKRLTKLITNYDSLDVLSYEDEFYVNYAKWIYINSLKENKQKFFIILVMLLLAFFILCILIELEDIIYLLLIFIVFLTLLFFFSKLMPYIYYKRSLKRVRVAIITKNCAYFMGNFHVWKKASFKRKILRVNNKEMNILTITYIYWDRFGKNSYELLIPIPKGKDINVRKIPNLNY